MNITKREVLVSIIIISIMLLFGTIIHGNINNNLMLKYQKYNTALQIENNSELFSYGMKTNIGYAFVYGDLEAIDTVTYPEIGGEYMYVEKVKEKYTMHTRVVTTTINGKTTTRTETYWTWDVVNREDKKCEEISFCGVAFDSGKINMPSDDYITTIKESSKIRYKYYGVKTKYTGTIFAELKDGTIPNNTYFHNNIDIETTMDSLKTGWELILFWILWIILTGSCVYGFCYLDNRWLEDRRRYY